MDSVTPDWRFRLHSPIALNREHPVALYLQIANWLERDILTGRLRGGERLDGEHVLIRRLSVSRVTVRQAVDHLVARGLVVRKQGKGTFVDSVPIRHDLQNPHSFFESLYAYGIKPKARLVEFRPAAPPSDVAESMRLAAKSMAVRILRVYMSGERPIAYGEGWLTPAALTLTRDEVEAHSTGSLLRNRLGIEILRTNLTFGAGLTRRAAGRLLQLPVRSPVLHLARTAFDTTESVVEMLRFTMNADAYEFSLAVEGCVPVSSGFREAAVA